MHEIRVFFVNFTLVQHHQRYCNVFNGWITNRIGILSWTRAWLVIIMEDKEKPWHILLSHCGGICFISLFINEQIIKETKEWWIPWPELTILKVILSIFYRDSSQVIICKFTWLYIENKHNSPIIITCQINPQFSVHKLVWMQVLYFYNKRITRCNDLHTLY